MLYDERFQAKYGCWRPIIERSVTAFLRCGDLHEGFARVRCPDCHHEMFVAFSCRAYDPDADWDSHPASSDPPGELTYVEIDEFLATF